jgi:hypothetical protein
MNKIIEFAKANCKTVFNDPAHTRIKYSALIHGYMQALKDNNIPLPNDGWEDEYDPASDLTYYGAVYHSNRDGFFAELQIGIKNIKYPLCKRDLDWFENLDFSKLSKELYDKDYLFKIIDGEAVMQEPEDDREPELNYE